MEGRKASLAVIFITLNEEYHIGPAIDNVKNIASEIWLVDSGSSDKTVEIAKSKCAKVVHHKFENFGAQWNFALSLPIKSEWTMKMDPDERLRPELKSEILASINSSGCNVGFEFDRVLWFMGKPMRGWKDRVARIWRTGRCRFTDVSVNEHPIIDGPIKRLHGQMDHLDSKDLQQWIDKQNKYTTQGAIAKYTNAKLSAAPKFWGTRLERRMWFKRVFFKLPFRYSMMFIQLYIGKALWLEGRTGIHCALLRVWARRLVEEKVMEMRNRQLIELN